MEIVTGIPTEIFYSIVTFLKNSKWKLFVEYSGFDKGIDFDLYQYAMDSETILMAWDNWLEGEIKTSHDNIIWLSGIFEFRKECIDPTYLTNISLMTDLKNLLHYYHNR